MRQTLKDDETIASVAETLLRIRTILSVPEFYDNAVKQIKEKWGLK